MGFHEKNEKNHYFTFKGMREKSSRKESSTCSEKKRGVGKKTMEGETKRKVANDRKWLVGGGGIRGIETAMAWGGLDNQAEHTIFCKKNCC